LLYQPSHRPNLEPDDELDVQDFGRAILRQWRTIAGIACVTTLFALYVVMSARPQFAADGMFYLGDGQTVVDTTDQTNFLSDYQVVSSVNTQLQLIQSPALLEQAILETGLNAPIVPLTQPALPYWKWRFLDHKSIAAFAPGPNGLVAQFAMFGDPASEGAAFDMYFDQDGHYRLMTPGSFFTKPQFFAAGQLGKTFSAGGISMMISTANGATTPPAGSAYSLTVFPAKTMAQAISGGLIVEATGPEVAPTNVADVRFLWDNPYQATTFVDYLMRDFIQSQLAWKTESASNTETYISQQLQKISTALAQANQNQASYQSQTGIVDVTTNSQAVVNQLSSYQAQRSTLLLQQEALQQLVTSVSKENGNINPYLISQVNDPVLANLSTTLAAAQVKLDSQEAEFTGQSTEVRQQEATIYRIQDAIKTLLQNDEALAVKNLANIDSMIAQYQAELKSIPAESLQVGQLTRSSDVLGTLYGLLMQKEEEAEVSKAATIEDTRIISPAELPLMASAPRPTITVLAGLLLGLIIGTGVVMLRRAFSSSFRSDNEIRREVPVPVYGIIPQIARKYTRRNIFAPGATAAFAESFRFLRYNLYEFPCEHKSRVVLVASATSGDGKTMIAANIAKVLADDEKRVLLIDADFHAGNIQDIFKLSPGSGFSEWLMQGKRPPFKTVPNQSFQVLTTGAFPNNPNELFNSKRPDLIFKTLREEFDFIIVDSPALPTFSDALPLARQADITLSVVSIGHTSRGTFATHCEMIEGLDALNGIVINNADLGSHAFGTTGRGRRARRAAKRSRRGSVAEPVHQAAMVEIPK
jgi:capsular exopolysaccharide synthesis family protein